MNEILSNHKGINRTRRNEMRQLKQEGVTYSELARRFGLSRQRIQQLVGYTAKEYKSMTQRAGGVCELCHNKVDKLQVHHISYIPAVIQIVCISCHMKLHNRGLTSLRKKQIEYKTYNNKLLRSIRREERIKMKKENYTSISVRREDAEEIKKRFPFLRTDALRFAWLLGHHDIIVEQKSDNQDNEPRPEIAP
jgi:lambda repressor-like predicted transcriptional regulator